MANQPHLRIFIRLDKTQELDGQTDRQICLGYNSGLHCEQLLGDSALVTLRLNDQ